MLLELLNLLERRNSLKAKLNKATMARHRDVRNLDAEDFESDFDYGSSYSGKKYILTIDEYITDK